MQYLSFFLRTLPSIFFSLLMVVSQAQNINSLTAEPIRTQPWSSQWITVPGEASRTTGVYHFRKEISLEEKTASFIVHVSADNRYKLYVNGTLVSTGPARGDITHWNYETVDLAPYLLQGKNTLSAVVWNYGSFMPEAQISYRTGFILQGNTDKEKIADSGPGWKCFKNTGHHFLKPDLGFKTYYVACPGESINGNLYPWGWEYTGYNDAAWPAAQPVYHGLPKGVSSWDAGWELVPRTIPPMEIKKERLTAIRKEEGIKVPAGFLKNPVAFVIPAHKKIKLILDMGRVTDAYPVLKTNAGKNAVITMRYAESLYQKEGFSADQNNHKGNRNEVEGKLFMGYKDEFVSDGGERTFTPLWFRVYRYIEFSVETYEEALTIEDLYGLFTAYPFELNSSFQSSDTTFKKILDVGWLTHRLNSHEIFMDAYFEQLQYVGDTRILALITYYNSGDDRLVRSAIRQFDNSRNSEGLTWCRWPANDPQFIPPFSLLWIMMVHDHWMYKGDSSFTRSMLTGTRSVIGFFEERQYEHKLLKKIPYWNFVDWSPGWQYGMPPSSSEGMSAVLDLHLLMAYDAAAELENTLGKKENADHYKKAAALLRASFQKTYWDETKKYFSDTPEKKYFSQHTNALAVLTNLVSGQQATDLMQRVLADSLLSQCSLYYKFYLNYAAAKAGLGERYRSLLGEWEAQLSRGMTTWAESPEPTRSDCHAWGSSPNIEAFRTVLGITPAAPGFREVMIAPNPGKLMQCSGTMPHPAGTIRVRYTITKKNQLNALIELPPGITGTFVWKGIQKPLHEGKQELTMPGGL